MLPLGLYEEAKHARAQVSHNTACIARYSLHMVRVSLMALLNCQGLRIGFCPTLERQTRLPGKLCSLFLFTCRLLTNCFTLTQVHEIVSVNTLAMGACAVQNCGTLGTLCGPHRPTTNSLHRTEEQARSTREAAAEPEKACFFGSNLDQRQSFHKVCMWNPDDPCWGQAWTPLLPYHYCRSQQ